MPHAARNGGNNGHDKFSLPTSSGLIEDFLEFGARRLITDAQFGRGGPKRFARDELKCQSGLGWRQAKVTPQQINGLVHVRACHLKTTCSEGAASARPLILACGPSQPRC